MNTTLVAEVSPTIRSNPRNNSNPNTNCDMLVAHALKAEGFDASEDGTGRGTPIIAENIEHRTSNAELRSEEELPQVVGALSDGAHMGGGSTDRTLTRDESLRSVAPAVSSKWAKGSGGPAGDECQNLVPVNRSTATCQGGFFNGEKTNIEHSSPGGPQSNAELRSEDPIAFSSKDHGADAVENLSPTLRASGHAESHANAGAPPAIAFQEHGRKDGRNLEYQEDIAYSLNAPNGGGRLQELNAAHPPIAFPARMSGTQRAASENVSPSIGSANPTGVAQKSEQCSGLPTLAVRRLTPRECERLQGFPDDYTLIPIKNSKGKIQKHSADGPRYKAIGNSMAVPNIEWIGRRMDLVDELVPWEGNNIGLRSSQTASSAALP